MDTEVYKSLSDETRLKIINILMVKPLCVCEIEMVLSVSQSNASRHLIKLKNSGIVDFHKKSQWVLYEIDKKFIENNPDLYKHLNGKFTSDDDYLKDREKLKLPEFQAVVCE